MPDNSASAGKTIWPGISVVVRKLHGLAHAGEQGTVKETYLAGGDSMVRVQFEDGSEPFDYFEDELVRYRAQQTAESLRTLGDYEPEEPKTRELYGY